MLLNANGIICIKQTIIWNDVFIRHYKGGENENKQTYIQTNNNNSSYKPLESDGRISWVYGSFIIFWELKLYKKRNVIIL